MPKYLLSIVGPEDAYTEENFGEVMEQHNDFSAAVMAAPGAELLGGEALNVVATATFLRHTRSADVAVVDNPAPELKETLGGYYLIQAESEEQAIELGKLCPSFDGYIEVRPVMEFE